MTGPLLLTVALVGLPAGGDDVPPAGAAPAEAGWPPLRKDEFREAYLAAMQRSAPRAPSDPADVAPELLALHGALDKVEGLSRRERERMRRRLQSRLSDLRDRLVRNVRARQPSARRRTAPPGRASFAGPADTAEAMRLIDLIQTTIAPESWDVNGGRGSIGYYSPLQALVVRQTGEVHHELGGLLEQLRR